MNNISAHKETFDRVSDPDPVFLDPDFFLWIRIRFSFYRSGSGCQISLDPDLVSDPDPRAECRKGSESYLLEENCERHRMG